MIINPEYITLNTLKNNKKKQKKKNLKMVMV